jgi:hypothetical protein
MMFLAADIFVTGSIWPALKDYYNPAAQLPIELAGVPGFEWLFGFVVGFVWPWAMGYICEMSWCEPSARSSLS